MNINCLNSNLSFKGIAPFAINEIRMDLKKGNATPEQYDNVLEIMASDRSGGDYTIETRLADGRSSGKYRVVDGKNGRDLGILHSLGEAVEYANCLSFAKHADSEEEKLQHFVNAYKTIMLTPYCDYDFDASSRLEKKMKKSVGLNIEA